MNSANNQANENEVKDQFGIKPRCYTSVIDLNDIPNEDLSQSLTYNSFYEKQLLAIIKSQLSYTTTPVGTTIALTGKWGSGKSTVIKNVRKELLDYINNEVNKEYIEASNPIVNYSADRLAKYTQELNRKYVDLKISEFKCLWYQGDDALMNAFLVHMNSQLNVLGKDIVRQFLDITSSIVDVAANIKSELKVLNPIINFFRKCLGKEAPKSIEEKLKKLAEALKQDNPKALKKRRVTKFLIIIDDLDRLYPNEVLAIFRIIKSVGFLPNIMFLLAFDKSIVDKTIAKYYPEDHKIFLEKFIQIYVDIPPKDISLFDNFKLSLARNLAKLPVTKLSLPLFQINIPLTKPKEILKEVFDLCVHTFRDVNRLNSSVSEKWLLCKEYINIYDLILLELLKMFCSEGWKLLHFCSKELSGDELITSQSLLTILKNSKDYQGLMKDADASLVFSKFLSYLDEINNQFPSTMFSCPISEYCRSGSIVSPLVFKYYFNTIPKDTTLIEQILKTFNNLGLKLNSVKNLEKEVNNTVNDLYEYLNNFTDFIKSLNGRVFEFNKILEENVESPIYLGVFMVLVRLIQDKNQETTSAIFYCFDGLFWRIAETSYRNIALNANHLEDNKLAQLRKTKRLDDYILSSICNLLEQEDNKDIINDIVKSTNIEFTLSVAFHLLKLNSKSIFEQYDYEEFNQLFYVGLNSLIDNNKFFKHYRCLCILIGLSDLYKDDKQDLLLALGKKINDQLKTGSIDNNLFKQAIYAFMCGSDIYCQIDRETLYNSDISSIRDSYVNKLLETFKLYQINEQAFACGLMSFIKNEIDRENNTKEPEFSLNEKEYAELLLNNIKKGGMVVSGVHGVISS